MQYAKSAVKEAQIDYVFDQLRVTGWPHTAAVVVTTGVLWFSTHSLLSVAWMALVLFSHGVRLVTLDRLWMQARQHGDYRRMKPLLVMGMTYAGALWGLVPIWFMNEPQTESVIFVSIALAGMCASTLPALAAYLPAYLAFVVPALALLIVKLFLLGLNATALLGVACLTAFVMISAKINQIISMSITMDFQNRELLEQVTVAKEKAEAANRAKSRFLAVASHDLRQPLQALGLILESMKLKARQQAPEQQSLIQQGVHCHDALSDMFNSLMDLSRLEANDLNVSLGHVELNDILQSLVREFQSAAEAKGIGLHLQSAPCVVHTDPLILGRILRNLISNAVKFTETGSVELRLQLLQDKVMILVQDTGVGIPLEEQARIFDEYHQVSNRHRLRQQGVGLGLAVVKRLVELLHLDLQLESVPQQGSTFTLVVPRGNPAALPKKEELSGVSLQGCRVLVVDDEPALLEATCSLLREWGCEVLMADSEQAALAHVDASAPPHIVLSDYHLGGSTGLSVIRSVQQCLQQPVPALLMSGDTSPELIQRIREHSLFLLQKPVKPVHLRKVMRQLLHA
ncbi:MAG: ATP-binding protein [Pseudomonadota bacterium]|nr:ATP-binding protein [Pseudomonadota bacterium]